MRSVIFAFIFLVSFNVWAHECVADSTDIKVLVDRFSERTGVKFALDPRVKAEFKSIGLPDDEITAQDLKRILYLHGFSAYEGGGIVYVMPSAIPLSVTQEFGGEWLE